MNLTERSVDVLRNFSGINPSIQFENGDTLKTISPNKTIMAKAKLDTTIDDTFCIYDLSRFLGIISTFNDPEYVVGDKHLDIKAGNAKVKYSFADVSNIITPPKKELDIGTPDVEFEMSQDNYDSVMKAIGIMSLPDLVVVGDGKNIILRGADTKNTTDETYDIVVGETDKTFNAVFRTENMKMIPADYKVAISSQGIAHFKSADVEYWVSIEANSEF